MMNLTNERLKDMLINEIAKINRIIEEHPKMHEDIRNGLENEKSHYQAALNELMELE